MSDHDKKSAAGSLPENENVIPLFPRRGPNANPGTTPPGAGNGETPSSPAAPVASGKGAPSGQAAARLAKRRRSLPKRHLAGTVIATILASVAVNHYVYKGAASGQSLGGMDLASSSGASSSATRSIASVERSPWERDAEWEKRLAEDLASTQLRDVASIQIGRPATAEEKLRWGTLEEKYTITYRTDLPDSHLIESVYLQDGGSQPAYILNREQFLRQYGRLLESDFERAILKKVETSDGKTVESYELLGKDNKAKGDARFELDRHKRLLSLKVEPVHI